VSNKKTIQILRILYIAIDARRRLI